MDIDRAIQRCAALLLLILLAAPAGIVAARPPDEGSWRGADSASQRAPAQMPALEGSICPATLVVQRGDTLGEIALRCRTTLSALLDLNPAIENPDIIEVGQKLVTPPFDGPLLYTTNVTVAEAAALPPGVAAGERWIDVDLSGQQLVAYVGTRPVFQSLLSSGRQPYLTVTGQFPIYRRYVSKDMDGRPLGYDYFLPGVPYAMYFYKAYALHGTYWHANFGTPMSHGCVNLPTPAAEWIFTWSTEGTIVNVHY